MQLESLEAENKHLRVQVQDQARQIKELEAALKEMSGKHFDRDNVAVAAVINYLIEQYPSFREKLPIFDQLKGMMGLKPDAPETTSQADPNPEGEDAKKPQKDTSNPKTKPKS